MAANPPTAPAPDPVPPQRSPRRGVTAMFWGLAALWLVVSLIGGHRASSDADPAPHAPPAAAASELPARASRSGDDDAGEAAGRAASKGPAGKHLPRSRPTRLLIPAISVDAPFTDLALDSSGQLEPPPADDTNLVGWYAKGASPGEAGTSIIAGHVDTATSPAVFAGLSELDKGDRFHVLRADGSRATFVVDDAESFAKDDFPDERVYADTPQAQVRLITCAGDYDHEAKDYTENLVVFAHLV
ncbi:class F sortase [Streptomyces sp. NPDC085946]|uniref:class F sortase n=1 Tax=Streptomyces sp. NPDC085946 TaxID=3365744 RepID=UPI0037CFB4C4